MIRSRRIGAFLAAIMAAVTIASLTVAPASAATPEQKGPRPVSALLPTVDDGEMSWVSVQWRTDQTICDAKLTVVGNRKVRIDYPRDTRFYASFPHGGTLHRRSTDFTPFRVTPRFGGAAWVVLAGVLTYNFCGRHARTRTMTTGFLLPVRA
jgi:hypothetical protein